MYAADATPFLVIPTSATELGDVAADCASAVGLLGPRSAEELPAPPARTVGATSTVATGAEDRARSQLENDADNSARDIASPATADSRRARPVTLPPPNFTEDRGGSLT
jgi:hypothetical protein